MTLRSMSHQLVATLPRAWRSLARRPGYFAIAVSSLAVALGVATTVIAHLDSLIHPDLGTPHDNRLFFAYAAGSGQTEPTYAEMVQFFRRAPGVERAGVVTLVQGRISVDVGGTGSAQAIWHASPGFFDAVGATPLRGRWFHANETAASGVALVTEDAWRNRLGATDSLHSARLIVDGIRYTIVGVVPGNLPPFPNNCRQFQYRGCRPSDVILPLDDGSDWGGLPFVVLLAKRGVSATRVRAAIAPVAGELSAKYGQRTRPWVVGAARATEIGGFDVTGYQLGMLAAVGIIVIIACANVSALMLARAVAKRRDQALRLALGAGRKHIVGDIAAEVSLIAIVGGLAAVVIGHWSMQVLAAVTPPDLPWLGFREPHWSPWVFGGLFGVVVLVVVAASIVPAFFVSGITPIEQLKDNSGTTTGRPKRTFQVLVVGELALSLILLFGAVLVAKSTQTVADFDFGYDARGLLRVTATVFVAEQPVNAAPPLGRGVTSAARSRTIQVGLDVPDAIAARLRTVPGVRDASWSFGLFDSRNVTVSDEGSAAGRELLNTNRLVVGPHFLRTLGLQLIAGRDFEPGDGAREGAVILDELAAQALFADGRGIGSRIKLDRMRGADVWLPVIGVVRTARHSMPDDPAVPAQPTIYISRLRTGGFQPSFVIRPASRTGDIRPAAAAIVSDLLPPGSQFTTGKWVSRFEEMLTTRRFVSGMFLTLSLASLVLAAAGLFGVLSYAVNQRMREFAVRVALGAQRTHVVRLVAHDGMLMALGGTAIGGAIAMYAAFTLWQWLWGVYPVDPVALVIAEGVLLGVTLLGAVLPALRATRANPVDVMRAN